MSQVGMKLCDTPLLICHNLPWFFPLLEARYPMKRIESSTARCFAFKRFHVFCLAMTGGTNTSHLFSLSFLRISEDRSFRHRLYLPKSCPDRHKRRLHAAAETDELWDLFPHFALPRRRAAQSTHFQILRLTTCVIVALLTP